MSDAISILMFLDQAQPVKSMKACDVNDDGRVDISDAINLLQFLNCGWPRPPQPYPGWGVDPTP